MKIEWALPLIYLLTMEQRHASLFPEATKAELSLFGILITASTACTFFHVELSNILTNVGMATSFVPQQRPIHRIHA